MSPRSSILESCAASQPRQECSDEPTTEPSPTSTDNSSSPLRKLVARELSNVADPQHPLDHRTNVDVPRHADETVSNPLFPPLPTHYSLSTKLFYLSLSSILSAVFLTVVMLGAMVKTVPSICWVIGSWCCFKDPNRLRPFYQQEKERRRIETGKLKCDVGYYANRVNLECEETEVVTEDGFILTIQHIVDRSAQATDWKRTSFAGS
jgi:hypothetical protein